MGRKMAKSKHEPKPVVTRESFYSLLSRASQPTTIKAVKSIEVTIMNNLNENERPTALAMEYQLEYGGARGDLNVSDLVNNPCANGKCSVNSLCLPEHPAYPLGR